MHGPPCSQRFRRRLPGQNHQPRGPSHEVSHVLYVLPPKSLRRSSDFRFKPAGSNVTTRRAYGRLACNRRDGLLEQLHRLVRYAQPEQHGRRTNWNDPSNWGGTSAGIGDVGLFPPTPTIRSPRFPARTAAIGGIWDTGSRRNHDQRHYALTSRHWHDHGNSNTGIELDSGRRLSRSTRPLVLQNNQQWSNNSTKPAHRGGTSGPGSLTTVWSASWH